MKSCDSSKQAFHTDTIRTAVKKIPINIQLLKFFRATPNTQDLELGARKLTNLDTLQSLYTKFTDIFKKKICKV